MACHSALSSDTASVAHVTVTEAMYVLWTLIDESTNVVSVVNGVIDVSRVVASCT